MSKRSENASSKVKRKQFVHHRFEFSSFLVEFCWFQAKPSQSLRLRMTEKQFVEGQQQIRSKSKSFRDEILRNFSLSCFVRIVKHEIRTIYRFDFTGFVVSCRRSDRLCFTNDIRSFIRSKFEWNNRTRRISIAFNFTQFV